MLTVNTLAENRPDSVGLPLPDVQLRLGPNDELLAKSPGVMAGYWHDAEASAAVIDADGWLHTGDIAAQRGRHWYITGRLKDIIVLANGEKVPPVDIEQALMLDPLIHQALLVGEGRPYLAAILVLHRRQWAQHRRRTGAGCRCPGLPGRPARRTGRTGARRDRAARLSRLRPAAPRAPDAGGMDRGQRLC